MQKNPYDCLRIADLHQGQLSCPGYDNAYSCIPQWHKVALKEHSCAARPVAKLHPNHTSVVHMVLMEHKRLRIRHLALFYWESMP